MRKNCQLLLSILLILSIFGTQSLRAQAELEGMWLPFKAAELNYEDMKALGFELPAEQIYDEDKASLEDAIVQLNSGSCTAELVSPKGLLFTNHHCSWDAITSLSSEANDRMTDGYWALSQEAELPVEGMTASVLIKSVDVTKSILGTDERPDPSAIEGRIKAMTREKSLNGKYRVDIKEMFYGLEYHMFIYEVFRDIRLVGAPPASIGYFGGDLDNFTWPRHTGDFAIFRIYADENNQPAGYSENNVPYQPKHFLPISMGGVEKGDYVMIMGYPGSTTRYLSSSAIRLLLDQSNPAKIKLLKQTTDIMKAAMDRDEAKRIALSANYFSLMNGLKYFDGQTTMLSRYDVLGEKIAEEVEFQKWADADPDRREIYGAVLEEIDNLHQGYVDTDKFIWYLNLAALASNSSKFCLSQLVKLQQSMSMGDESAVGERVNQLKTAQKAYFDTFFREVDQEVFAQGLMRFYEDVPKELHPPILSMIVAENPEVAEIIDEGKKKKKKRRKKRKKQEAELIPKVQSPQEKIQQWAAEAYGQSIVADQDKMASFLANPSQEVLQRDPLLRYSMDILSFYQQKVGMTSLAFKFQIKSLRRSLMAGKQEMNPNKNFYPDANSTMRITYGTVEPYEPRDGIQYHFQTTLDGVMEKEDPNVEVYVVPDKLKELWQNKDYGPYADEGIMEINFLTTADVTGGSSGSPVINSKGQITGLAFDGNWEAMSNDIYVFPKFKRTICVDIRYVLFVIDKFAGASYLFDEMTILDE